MNEGVKIMKTLVVYASKHGCAEKCVNLLKNKLHGEVVTANAAMEAVPDVATFDSVIIGGSIYAGRIQKEIKEFCTKNLDLLKQKKVGLFICGMLKGDKAQEQLKGSFPAELVAASDAMECFGGEVQFHKMNFMEKLIMKMVSKADKSIPAMDKNTNISDISEENIERLAQRINIVMEQ